MKLYNELSQTVEPFSPVGDAVTVYVCGVTPYDTTHLGHAFTYASFDILIRFLEHQGHTVKYVQNVTDIDDDILRKSKEVGDDWQALGSRWTAHFIEDMQTLNIRPPEHYPGATEVVPEIVAAVQNLIELGIAYESGGSVYYHVDNWSDFGKLSRIPAEDRLAVANERGNFPDDPKKKAPLDFVLWQAAAPGEPTWDSPWGPGRPGWHIECSTMSSKFLGQTIDIHGGGSDLIFPHHECEIAQAEPILNQGQASHVPFTRFWLHTAMVHHEGEKMSKSLGNLVMARDLLKSWSADALRLYLGSYHYREVWGHDPERLAWAGQLAETLLAAATVQSGAEAMADVTELAEGFVSALNDDLHTADALGALADVADAILLGAKRGENVTKAQDTLRQLGAVFGLQLDALDVEERVRSGWNKHIRRYVS